MLRRISAFSALLLVAVAANAGTAGEDVWAVVTSSRVKVDEQMAARAVDEHVSSNAGRALSILNERDPSVRELFVRIAYLVSQEKVVSAQAIMFDARRLPAFAGSQTGRYLAIVIDNLTSPPMDDPAFLAADAKIREAIGLVSRLRPELHRCAGLMIRGRAFSDEIAHAAGVHCAKERKATTDEKAKIMAGVKMVSFRK